MKEVSPLLLTFGEDDTDNHNASNLEIAFAAVLPQLQTAAALLRQLTLLVVNQLSQLGALCSEQTRKSTVISGTIMHILLQHSTALVALLTSLSRRSLLIPDHPVHLKMQKATMHACSSLLSEPVQVLTQLCLSAVP